MTPIEEDIEFDGAPRRQIVDRPPGQPVGLEPIEMTTHRWLGRNKHFMHELARCASHRESMRAAIHEPVCTRRHRLQQGADIVHEAAIELPFGSQHVRSRIGGIERAERHAIEQQLEPVVLDIRCSPYVPALEPDAIEPVDDSDRMVFARRPRCLPGATHAPETLQRTRHWIAGRLLVDGR
ncbi:hypothetical protein ACTJIL_12520 [Luteimonas sp. 22616]|uniref:hypothetical protein n=1 Tax=Luteimonas sp. 22616 TaxID=3453951 RepID=UPI003F85A01B